MKTWLLPRTWERRYGRFLAKNIRQLKAELIRQLGRLESFAKYRDKDDEEILAILMSESNRMLSDSEKISAAIAATLLWWQRRRREMDPTFDGYFYEVNKFNDEQYRAVVKDQTGIILPASATLGALAVLNAVSAPIDIIRILGENVDIYRTEPWLEGVKDNWKRTQIVYADKAAQGVISDAEVILRQGIATKAKVDDTVGTIDKTTETAAKRADVFGQNQVNNEDVELTERRQRALGAEEYIWRTMRDERVRGNPNGLYPRAKPSHWAREDQIFRWDNPPEGGHPGQAINCRCRALMRLPR